MGDIIWQFLALFFSGWLYVDAAYRGPRWQRWVFKPLTLLLLLGLAWNAPAIDSFGYLVLAGLAAALIADALSLLSEERFMYVIGALFISHLLYAVAFATQLNITFFWPLPLILLAIGAIVLAIIWTRLEELRWPVATYLAITLIMVWIAGECYYDRGSSLGFSLLAGALLLLASDIVWLISRYRVPFKASPAVIAACYFAGHFLIVRALYL